MGTNNTLAAPEVGYDPMKGMSAYAKRLWLEHPALSKTHVVEVARLEATLNTNQMDKVQLAKVYAAHVGNYSREGGWIYSGATDKPLFQGWSAYAERLVRIGRIVPGKGINWNKKGL